jgi:putative membrane protein
MFCSNFGGRGGFGPGNVMGYEGMFLGMGFRLLIFIVVIFIGVKLYKEFINKSNSALKILNEKYAGGEISEEEYIKRRNILLDRKIK